MALRGEIIPPPPPKPIVIGGSSSEPSASPPNIRGAIIPPPPPIPITINGASGSAPGDAAPNTSVGSAGQTIIPGSTVASNIARIPGDVAGAGNAFLPSIEDLWNDATGKSNKTAEQQAGDAATTALTVASLIPGVGPEELVAKTGLTGGKAIAARIAANLGLGGLFGASGDIGSGETDPGRIAQSAEDTALLGGGLGIGAEAGGGILNKIAGRDTETRLTAQTNRLKTLGKTFKENSTRTTDPITTLVKNTDPEGTPLASLFKVKNSSISSDDLTNPNGTGALDNAIQSHSDDASQLVNQLKGGVPLTDFEAKIKAALSSDPTIRGTLSLPKALGSLDSKIASAKMTYGDTIPYKAIDEIRAGMNKVYDPTEKDVSRVIGDTARQYLYNGDATNAALRASMANESELIKAKNFAEKIHGTKVPGGQLGKYFADLIGAGVGSSLGSMGGPLGQAAGFAGGAATTHAVGNLLQGMYFKPLGAKGAQSAVDLFKEPLVKTATGATRAGILRSASPH